VNWQQDPHGNWLARFVFPEKTTEFSVISDLRADIEVINPFDFFIEPYAEKWPFKFPPEMREDLVAFIEPDPVTPRLKEFIASISREPRSTVNFLVEINQRLQRMIRYLIRMEPGVQPPEETLASCAGSCRDTAWLLVQIMRHLGLPARFVSGYLIQLRPDVKPLEGPAGAEIDFTDLHAWSEVYLPGAGWIGLDATQGFSAARVIHQILRRDRGAFRPLNVSGEPIKIIGGSRQHRVDSILDTCAPRARHARFIHPVSRCLWCRPPGRN
jgi:transglutaminase-like putative cysteine protease